MRTYLIHRLLLFVPTLLLVLLVVFAVLHAVPAVPAIGPDSGGDNVRETILAFRRQYGLDRPVFLNLLPGVTRSEVEAALRGDDPAALEDIGRFAAPHLAALAADPATDPAIRSAALAGFARVAREAVAVGESLDMQRRKERERLELARIERPGAESVDQRAAAAAAFVAARSERFAPEGLARWRIALLETRFASYLRNVFCLDFGTSMTSQQPVLGILWGRLKVSVGMSLASIFLAYLLAIPIGVWSATRAGRTPEATASVLLFALYSLPVYFAATLLLRFFAVGEPFEWFPSGGFRSARGFDALGASGRALDVAHHLVLPVICLVYPSLAYLSRFVRASMLDTLHADFVRTARAKGLSERAVVYRHALKNSLLPLVTLLGNVLPAVFGGALIVEVVFDIPGVGKAIYDAILTRDYSIVLASTLILALLTLVGYLLSDLAHAWIDPRVTFGGAEGARPARGAA